MAITTPDAVPGEVIDASWGDAVRTDLTTLENMDAQLNAAKVAKVGDVMSGSLQVGGFPSTNGRGWWFSPNGVLHGLVAPPDVAGEANMILNRIGNVGSEPATAGGVYVRFYRGWGSTVGSIAVNPTTNGVVYNTTSDKRLKTLTGPLDPADALAKIAALEPVVFVWSDNPAAGEQVGFFAQDAAAVAPEIVTPGEGEPGEDGFTPWMVHLAELVPTLVGAIQGLAARVAALETTP